MDDVLHEENVRTENILKNLQLTTWLHIIDVKNPKVEVTKESIEQSFSNESSIFSQQT